MKKRPIKSNTYKNADHSLYQAITALENPAEAQQFLEDLCTPNEIQAMADRWHAVSLIKEDKPYRAIQAETGISVTTIGRVARCIILGSNGYNIVYERLMKRKNEDKFKIKNRDSKKRATK